jgi:hypothetical protein
MGRSPSYCVHRWEATTCMPCFHLYLLDVLCALTNSLTLPCFRIPRTSLDTLVRHLKTLPRVPIPLLRDTTTARPYRV